LWLLVRVVEVVLKGVHVYKSDCLLVFLACALHKINVILYYQNL